MHRENTDTIPTTTQHTHTQTYICIAVGAIIILLLLIQITTQQTATAWTWKWIKECEYILQYTTHDTRQTTDTTGHCKRQPIRRQLNRYKNNAYKWNEKQKQQNKNTLTTDNRQMKKK